MRITTRRIPVAATAIAAVAFLGACGSSSPAPTASSTQATPVKTTPTDAATAGVAAKDFWVKAVDGNMTGAFGQLVNASGKDVVVVSGESPSAGKVELHEVVKDSTGATKMQPKAGGFTLKASSTYELKPGGDHIMLMMLKGALKPGDKVNIVLTLDNGEKLPIEAVVKTFTAAQETYVPATSS